MARQWTTRELLTAVKDLTDISVGVYRRGDRTYECPWCGSRSHVHISEIKHEESCPTVVHAEIIHQSSAV